MQENSKIPFTLLRDKDAMKQINIQKQLIEMKKNKIILPKVNKKEQNTQRILNLQKDSHFVDKKHANEGNKQASIQNQILTPLQEFTMLAQKQAKLRTDNKDDHLQKIKNIQNKKTSFTNLT
jgi:hypothetical protein